MIPPKPRVLFLTDRSEFHQQHVLRYAPPNMDVIMRRRPDPAELDNLLPTIDYMISERGEVVSAAMIGAAPKLRLIVRLGSLLVGIDQAAARERHIPIALQPIVGTIYVAEHVLMMALATLKHLGRSLWQANSAEYLKEARRTDENTFSFNWLNIPDIGGLYEKSIGILGMGEIGVEFARRAVGFRPMAIYYHKRTRYPEALEKELGLTYADLDHLSRHSDVLISLLPYSGETDQTIDRTLFDKLKQGAILVHAGSGSVINETDMIAAIQSGQLAGAALDTFEFEPLVSENPLVAIARDPLLNLLLTPHTAAASLPESREEDYGEIVRHMEGEPLRFVV